MWRQLRSVVGIGQRVQLIKLVCNHRSFAQTVENIFTLSFLVSCYGGPVLVTTQVTRHTCGRSCRPVEAAVLSLWSLPQPAPASSPTVELVLCMFVVPHDPKYAFLVHVAVLFCHPPGARPACAAAVGP